MILLRRAAPIYLDAGGLRAREATIDRQLRARIEAAKRDRRSAPPIAISASCFGIAPTLRLSVVPMPRTKPVWGAGAAAFIVFVEADESVAAPTVESAARRYRLTRAETELLRALVAGHALRRAAADLGRSYNTARNQLQSIFAKTGTHHQGELIVKAQRDPA